jgi:hypothetical protein
MIHKNLIFRFDPSVSIVDEITEEDDIPVDIGDDIEPISTATSPEGWNDIWLDLEEEAADTEG